MTKSMKILLIGFVVTVFVLIKMTDYQIKQHDERLEAIEEQVRGEI